MGKDLSKITISHFTVNPQSVARETLLQLYYCNLSSKSPQDIL